jgi:hypothetical protein
MWHTLLLLHVCGAVVGLLAGFAAMLVRKGSNWHGATGTVFFASMLVMSSTAAVIAAFHRVNAANMCVGLFTFYLVATSWWAAKNREGRLGRFDRGAFGYVVLVVTLFMTYGVQAAASATGTKDGMPPFLYFMFGTFALVCLIGDVRMFGRGGATGTHRIGRHLRRMGLALMIATLSFYPGQAKFLPKEMKEMPLIWLPHIFLLVSLFFWMWRYRVRRRPRPQPETAATALPLSPLRGERVARSAG